MKKLCQLFCFLIIFTLNLEAKIQEENQANVISEVATTIPLELKDRDRTEVLESTMEEKRIVKEENFCYHANIDDWCFNKTNAKGCECELNYDTVVCCNVTDIIKSVSCIGSNSLYKNIHIINLSQSEMNVSQLNIFKQVDALVITDGNISKINGQFAKFTSIKCMNFSNNNITEINERAFSHLNQLKILDLSANNLTKLPSLQNLTIDVKGNSRIACSNISNIMDKGIKFLNKEVSMCARGALSGNVNIIIISSNA